MQRGPEIGRCYELSGADYTIGRGPDNDLVVDDGLVARYHAVIQQDGQRVVVVDLGGEHPVTVNEVPQEPGTPARLEHRDVVGIGRCVFSYQQPHKAATQPVPTLTYSGEAQSTVIEAV